MCAGICLFYYLTLLVDMTVVVQEQDEIYGVNCVVRSMKRRYLVVVVVEREAHTILLERILSSTQAAEKEIEILRRILSEKEIELLWTIS